MKLQLFILVLMVVLVCMIEIAETKKSKGISNIFGKKKKGGKKKKAKTTEVVATTTAVTPALVKESITSKVAAFKSEHSTAIASFKSAHSTAIAAKLSVLATATSFPKLKPTKLYKKRANLKLVYKSVMPPGQKRPENNVVFEFTDNEEGKTCRCVCRMK